MTSGDNLNTINVDARETRFRNAVSLFFSQDARKIAARKCSKAVENNREPKTESADTAIRLYILPSFVNLSYATRSLEANTIFAYTTHTVPFYAFFLQEHVCKMGLIRLRR